MRRLHTATAIPLVRLSTSSLGGSFRPDLEYEANRRLRAARSGSLSTVRTGQKKVSSVVKKKLDPEALSTMSPTTSSGVHGAQVLIDITNPVGDDAVDLKSEEISNLQLRLLADDSSTHAFEPSAPLKALQSLRSPEEYDETTTPLQRPRHNVFSDELDAIERAFMSSDRASVVQRIAPFKRSDVYETSMLDDDAIEGKSQAQCLDGAHDSAAMRAAVRKSKYIAQYPRRAYRRGIAILPEAPKQPKFCNSKPKELDGENDRPQEENPHFPLDNLSRAAEKPTQSAAAERQGAFAYDAYVTRPHDHTLVSRRGVEFWDDAENRKLVDSYENAHRDAVAHEFMTESPIDNVRQHQHSDAVRNEVLLFHRAYPANECIQDAFVRISTIQPQDGSPHINIPTDEQHDMPLSEARALARQHGLDLIRVAEVMSPERFEQGMVGICTISNRDQMMRRMVQHKLLVKGGVQAQSNPRCVEVPFRGGIHPHAIRFKSVGIAKLLVRRTPVRINLTDFGSPREGFPIFQTILDEIKKQCLPLRAFHRAGLLQSNYNEIFCFLHPATARNPKFGVEHPSTAEINVSRDQRIMQDEKETYFEEYYRQNSMRERNQYGIKLENGTAWADRDEGLSLRRQRQMKVMLGYLPKGNHEIYAARGDVNVPHPFRSSHPTSLDKWSYPRESNLEQSSRASLVLGKRMSMDVSDMHAAGETEENPSTVERFYYKVKGPALEVGAMKESFGLKSNRKKVPGLAPGWATLGVHGNNGNEPHSIRK
jgi:hypothetical protein